MVAVASIVWKQREMKAGLSSLQSALDPGTWNGAIHLHGVARYSQYMPPWIGKLEIRPLRSSVFDGKDTVRVSGGVW